jgi:hypothetical protein
LRDSTGFAPASLLLCQRYTDKPATAVETIAPPTTLAVIMQFLVIM